eukprot:TRINITY_DN54110_c0_g1_i1.p1 TRINITY_DN54110_c0_g1~~TRINITY_DN54110_c0_g1_i1.p1  ORF type:complete len:361 (-),score=61.76 TRINITY_DN54110_c0_g1_i1:90-1172(-)
MVLLSRPRLSVCVALFAADVWVPQSASAAILAGSSSSGSSSTERLRGGSGRLGRRGLRAAAREERPTCSCDCCDVVERRPDEVVNGVSIKCSPAAGHSEDVCGSECAPAQGDRILGEVAQDGGLDYQRFCFFECKPAEGVTSPVTTQCVALEDSDVRLILDPAGNALDPASVYARPSSSGKQGANAAFVSSSAATSSSLTLLGSRQQEQQEQPPQAQPPSAPAAGAAAIAVMPATVDEKLAMQTTLQGFQQALAQAARADRAAAASRTYEETVEQRRAAAEADPFAQLADIRSSSDANEIYAGRAESAAQAAIDALLAAKAHSHNVAQAVIGQMASPGPAPAPAPAPALGPAPAGAPGAL